jgi:hypothetical protein
MMTSDEFIEAVRSRLDIGDRQIRFDNVNRYMTPNRYDTIFIHYFNLPEGIGDAGGGAERENNRLMLAVNGFGRGQSEPAPGKVKVSTSVCHLGDPHESRKLALRGKTASPEKMVEYVVNYLNKVARDVPPRLTHTRGVHPEWEV